MNAFATHAQHHWDNGFLLFRSAQFDFSVIRVALTHPQLCVSLDVDFHLNCFQPNIIIYLLPLQCFHFRRGAFLCVCWWHCIGGHNNKTIITIHNHLNIYPEHYYTCISNCAHVIKLKNWRKRDDIGDEFHACYVDAYVIRTVSTANDWMWK